MLSRRLVWALVTFLSVLVALAATTYFRFDPSLYFPQQREVFEARQFALYLHVGGALVALAVGPWQFARRLRDRRPRLHRALGGTYVVGVLLGGAGGLALATTAHGGPVATGGFLALGVLWLVTTASGVRAIARRDVAGHRRWMVRSFSLAFAAVTLRLYLATYAVLASTEMVSLDFATAYAAIAWLAWVPNLGWAWWWTRRRPASPSHVPRKRPSGPDRPDLLRVE